MTAALAPSASRPSSAAPTIGADGRHQHLCTRSHLANPLGDPLDRARRRRPDQAAAQHHVRGRVGELEPLHGDGGERDHLVGQAADDLGRDRILLGRREHDARQLAEPVTGQRLQMDGAGDVERLAEPVVGGNGGLEDRPGPAAVGAARGRHQRREPDVVATAPVTGDPAQGREPGLAAVRGESDAVDAAAAHDGDAPAAVGARAQERQGVVVDDEPLAPLQGFDGGAQRGELLGQIGAGDHHLRRRRARIERRETGRRQRVGEQSFEQLDTPVDADVVG